MKKLIGIITIIILIIVLIIGCKSQDLIGKSSDQAPEVFKWIKESFIDYEFKVTENLDSFIISGEYDLNDDGIKDKISLSLKGYDNRREESYIEVNGIRKDVYIDYTYDGEVKLLDLDKNDNFIEIAFFDEGPSADPQYHIYRYDGKELYKLGNIDDEALIDGYNKIIPSIYKSHFEPTFYSAWLEVKDDKFIFKNKSVDEYLGKTYTLKKRDSVFFSTMEEMDKDFQPTWEEARTFETTELKLIELYYPYDDKNFLNFYFVELPSGEKGIMYFWLGD